MEFWGLLGSATQHGMSGKTEEQLNLFLPLKSTVSAFLFVIDTPTAGKSLDIVAHRATI
jgi:hypothetical protein